MAKLVEHGILGTMMLRASLIAAVALTLAPAGAQAAVGLFNGGFEGGLAGWSTDESLVQVPMIAYHRDADNVADARYRPVTGSMMAKLQADQGGAPVTLSQTFFVDVASRFSGWAAFLGEDYDPFFDSAYVRLAAVQEGDVTPAATPDLFTASVGPDSVGAYGFTPWTRFSTYLAPGQYTIEAGVVNFGDGDNPSFLLVDNFRLSAGIPEPTTWVLMLTGFFGLGAMLRRRAVAA